MRNRITGHTLTRKLNGLSGTIRVKYEGRTKTVKWRWSNEYSWEMSGVPSEVKRFCVAYLQRLLEWAI